MSDEQDNLSPADRELEAALKSLAPSHASRIDPVAAAFTAGSRAAQRQIRMWQSAVAAVLIVSIGSWLFPLDRDRTAPATAPERVVMSSSTPAPPPNALARQSVVMLQHAMREKGVDGLPATELPTVRNLRISELF
jgi:hypothetical protein